MSEPLKAPFPYFGGKMMIADNVWQALGQPDHYIEPFFGSGAVLLRRPNWDNPMTETVNDKDGFLCNVWRAIQFDPDQTAYWADFPVNHADLMARRKALIANEQRLLENLVNDDLWFDAQLAGYWIWAASCWIGAGLTRKTARPHLSGKGMGVHATGKRPHLSGKGMGLHATGKLDIYEWFQQLSERLRYVRVVCGDWSRVCGGDWQDNAWRYVGMFFDPPYAVSDRDAGLYHHDSQTVGRDVEEWCLERGARANYRIVVTGYESEYQSLVEAGWRTESWQAFGGYSNTARNGKDTRGKRNRQRETIFYSPNCLINQGGLFDAD